MLRLKLFLRNIYEDKSRGITLVGADLFSSSFRLRGQREKKKKVGGWTECLYARALPAQLPLLGLNRPPSFRFELLQAGGRAILSYRYLASSYHTMRLSDDR